MTDGFLNVSNAMADLVERLSAGIVRVDGRRRFSASGIIWKEGVVVAAHHAVKRDEGVMVGLPDGTTVPASVAGRDRNTDLVVLRVESDLPPLNISTETPRVGSLILALARPWANVQATLGIISAVGSGRLAGVLQTDVVMYPGFSGGPLVDAAGNVLGMNTSGFRRATSTAVAAGVVDRISASLLEHGSVRQGFLGVGAQAVRLPDDLAESLGQETGLMLASVEADGPAAKSGIYQGDIIIALDDEPTPHLDALLMLLGGERIGDEVAVKFVRGGKVESASVTVGERPAS